MRKVERAAGITFELVGPPQPSVGTIIWDEKSLRRKSKGTVNLKTLRTEQFCTALHTLLMMTAESMLSKPPVLRFTVALLFLISE